MKTSCLSLVSFMPRWICVSGHFFLKVEIHSEAFILVSRRKGA